MIAAERSLVIGVLVGPHGLRGVVKAQLHNPQSRALREGLTITLGADQKVRVLACEYLPARGQARLTLEGIHDRDAAEALRGLEVRVDRDELPPLAADEFYLTDVVGWPVERVVEGEAQALGTVEGVRSIGGRDFLDVLWKDTRGRRIEWLLPVDPVYIAAIEGERVRVELPEGVLPEALERP
ncbi:MAG: ribosome maturation factor RimM [Nannocystaceae bacterium]|nr:16S rRNA processing protein RimM [Myxococcales bacterium]